MSKLQVLLIAHQRRTLSENHEEEQKNPSCPHCPLESPDTLMDSRIGQQLGKVFRTAQWILSSTPAISADTMTLDPPRLSVYLPPLWTAQGDVFRLKHRMNPW